jgi:DNA-binding transcriptional regulator LsrR (DeoR family)
MERLDLNNYESARLIYIILNMYYFERRTQEEIARDLNLSKTKINRLLQQAREQGLVEISIHTPFQSLFSLEARLKAVFGLVDALVIPPVPEGSSIMLHSLGQAGARYLLKHLRDGDIVTLGAGQAIYSLVEALETPRSYDIQVVPMLGASQDRVISDVNYLAVRMAEHLNGKAYQLHAPAFVDNREQQELLMQMRPVKDILDISRKANIALTGLGIVSREAKGFVRPTALTVEDMDRIVGKFGGVGDIAANIYNLQGELCSQEYSNRVIGLTLEEFKQIPYRIGIAATAAKARPIYGALRGRYLHALITDEAAARGVLEIFDKEFHS